jgi:hypothetical protein
VDAKEAFPKEMTGLVRRHNRALNCTASGESEYIEITAARL